MARREQREDSTVTRPKAKHQKLADRKDGCSWFPSCFTCPLPACRFEIDPTLMQKVLARLRSEEDAARPTREPVVSR